MKVGRGRFWPFKSPGKSLQGERLVTMWWGCGGAGAATMVATSLSALMSSEATIRAQTPNI